MWMAKNQKMPNQKCVDFVVLSESAEEHTRTKPRAPSPFFLALISFLFSFVFVAKGNRIRELLLHVTLGTQLVLTYPKTSFRRVILLVKSTIL
jgi:hypothetical protein